MNLILKKTLRVAVATAMAMGVVTAQAATLSDNNRGDMAIIPYFTVNGNFKSGIHITNTTDHTQVVKVRYHRGNDSNDALDFIVLLSPRDEFTGTLEKNAAGHTAFRPSDNSCTVPAVDATGYLAPPLGVDLDDDGYATVIGMGQAFNEQQQIAVDATHVPTAVANNTALPNNCDRARENFRAVRTDAFNIGAGATVAGDFRTAPAAPFTIQDTGVVTPSDTVVVMNTAATGVTTHAVSQYIHTPDNALSVTYFIRDHDSGLEFGDNATHFNDFASQPLMANQEYGIFGPNGLADPRCGVTIDARQCRTGHDFPNLEGGSSFVGFGAQIGRLQSVRNSLATPSVGGDWANNLANKAQTDWVVTFPGQNLLPTTTGPRSREIPVRAFVNMWDREEGQVPDLGLVVSPNTGIVNQARLSNEVNVINWRVDSNPTNKITNVLGAAGGTNATVAGSMVNTFTANRGIAELNNFAAAGNGGFVFDWGVSNVATNALIPVALPQEPVRVPVVGITAWNRSFGDANRNYGRIVDLIFARTRQ